jgi:quinol monooxygenase YgiN
MIVEYIRYQIPEDEAGSFENAYRTAGASLAASPHCERYEIARCTEDPAAYTVRIEWDSAEGHMQGFRGSPEFRSFFAAVKPYVDQIEEMRHYEVLHDQPVATETV